MTEGQKLHRLLGCMYGTSKRSFFYEDLLEDFNDGLWLGKIEHNDLVSLCEILVRDELANFVEGSHPSVATPSNRDASKGITIHNEGFTAYINNKYDDGVKAPPAWKWTAIGASLLAIAAFAYVFYLKSENESKMEKARSEYLQIVSERNRNTVRMDSILAAKEAIIKKQAERIKVLETPPPAPPKKATKTTRRR